MKKFLTTYIIAITISLLFSTTLKAQIEAVNALKNKAKSTAVKLTEKTTEKDEPSEDSSKSETKLAVVIAAEDMKAGEGYFFTSFKSNGYKSEVTASEELYVRMQLGKNMIEWSQEKGIQADYTAYGFVTVYIDGEKIFMTKPISFASNISKQWAYIDFPLNVSYDFLKQIESDQSMLETQQDIWMFQQLFQENSIPKQYGAAAMSKLASGNHKVKVEFGLGQSDSKEPMAVICTGEVAVKSAKGGSNALAKLGPKHLRPLNDDEKGQFVFSSSTFTPGLTELSVKLELPKAPKYYNMKWCKANTCDYDHGTVLFYASFDGEPLAAWSTVLWDADYNSKKVFEMTILPLSDANYGSNDAVFNKSILYKSMESPFVYALLDMLYGNQLSVGNHKLTIKMYSQESVPYGEAYEFSHSYFSKWPSIAENTVEFNVTQEGLNKLISNSTAVKLTHAGGEWTSVDKALFDANSKNQDFQLIDIATTSTWKIVKNSFGAILYRECRADAIYKSKFGYRLSKNLVIKSDYSGNGTYSIPYLASGMGTLVGPSELGTMHLPVPLSKIK